jgi:hypothetical protein
MRRIKMFEAQQGRTEDYKQVDKISDERLEEITEGELNRVRSVLEPMGLEYRHDTVHYYFYLGEDDPQMVFTQTYAIGNLEITHFIVISKTEDDWWQVEFIVETDSLEEDYNKAMFICDGLRGLEALLRGHVANKVKEIKSLKDIMRSVSNPGL